MKKTTYFIFILISILLLSSCTIHFPYDFEMTGRQNKIVFKVVPEDALLLLNGKMIGEVYEFSTWESALILSSKNNEIIIKRDGFIEEVIDLYEYQGREFIVKINLNKAKEYRRQKTIIKKKNLKQKNIDQEKLDVGVPVKPKEFKKLDIKPDKERMSVERISVSLMLTPSDAAIYINKKFWGISPKSGRINMILKKGKYIIEITKPGYKNVLKKITISGEKKNLKIKIALQKK